ncbi:MULTISPECIES: DUF1931 family protein [Bradyrhizobium]|nr:MULTISPECIES: DUF1931 family protein [Bradyrhizobium]
MATSRHDRRGATEQGADQPGYERGQIRAASSGLRPRSMSTSKISSATATLSIGKSDDLLVRAKAVTKANGRAVIQPFDLPIIKGLQQSVHEFEKIDEEIELRPILEHLAIQPPLELAYGEGTEDQLPVVVGGLSVALARAFKIIDGDLKNPATRHWQQCFRIFDLLM